MSCLALIAYRLQSAPTAAYFWACSRRSPQIANIVPAWPNSGTTTRAGSVPAAVTGSTGRAAEAISLASASRRPPGNQRRSPHWSRLNGVPSAPRLRSAIWQPPERPASTAGCPAIAGRLRAIHPAGQYTAGRPDGAAKPPPGEPTRGSHAEPSRRADEGKPCGA
jgi:hypothetical protein